MRDGKRIRTHRPGAEDGDLPRRDIIQAWEQHAAAAVVALQAPRADLYGETPGDRRHRREDRIAAARLADRVINDERCAAGKRRIEELRIRRELLEAADDLTAPRSCVFSLLQLL